MRHRNDDFFFPCYTAWANISISFGNELFWGRVFGGAITNLSIFRVKNDLLLFILIPDILLSLIRICCEQ